METLRLGGVQEPACEHPDAEPGLSAANHSALGTNVPDSTKIKFWGRVPVSGGNRGQKEGSGLSPTCEMRPGVD